MLAYQQRVIDEKAELDTKREALSAYLRGAHFPTLSFSEQDRLTAQSHAMTAYSAILGARIAAFVD